MKGSRQFNPVAGSHLVSNRAWRNATHSMKRAPGICPLANTQVQSRDQPAQEHRTQPSFHHHHAFTQHIHPRLNAETG